MSNLKMKLTIYNASKTIKHLAINLTKEVPDLYTVDNKKHHWKRLKMYINGKTACVCGLEDLVSLRRQYSPKWFPDPRQSLSKPQLPVLQQLQAGPKISYETQGIQKSQTFLEKNKEHWYFLISNLI